ncbi:unnamed protein product [Didymodactylos carnosus]|uniref:Uncharacterized protein n=1 Tax=Didymodactylos carnosus TaxID=1234261 RepID=A0A8S2E9M4_9BILA|nr:unnamed protein product [Didymodactylos carnosus]CAF3974774.1 unnamed protein product [Didymodactylos carnosus]
MGSILNKSFSYDDLPVPLHLAGSMADGQYEAKYVADDILTEYDLMLILKAQIDNENEIEYIAEAPGYIRIYGARIKKFSCGSINDQIYINGNQLKTDIYSKINEQNTRTTKSSSTSVDKASLYFQFSDGLPPVDPDALQKILAFRNNLTEEQKQIGQQNIKQFCLFLSDLFNRKAKEFLCNFSKDLFHIELPDSYTEKLRKRIETIVNLYKTLYSSLVGIPIPSNFVRKIQFLLEFYKKYRHIVDEDARQCLLDQIVTQSSAEDCDIVIALKLNFWPKITHTRLNYLRCHKHDLYNKIKCLPVYAIPKWSKLTQDNAASYEFRLSFSAVETVLAKSRSNTEKLLNKIARGIYYKYLKHFTIQSFFIKTCVLWMCEQFDLDKDYKNRQEHLTMFCVNYIRQKLNEGVCLHYFIEQLNILAAYDLQILKQAYVALENVKIAPQQQANKQITLTSNVITFYTEMVEEFHELQLKNFDEQCPIYLPGKYDLWIEKMYEYLLIIEQNNKSWWDDWNHIISYAGNDENEIDLSGMSALDVVSIFFHFIFDLQRRWPVIKQMIFEHDTMTQLLINKHHTLVSYAIHLCENWIYDRILNYLKQDRLVESVQHDASYTDARYKKPLGFSVSVINNEEPIKLPLDILLDQFWKKSLTDIIEDIFTLSGAGYLIVKLVFAVDERNRHSNLLRFTTFVRLLLRRLFRVRHGNY